MIDSRQSYLQDVVVAGLRALDYNREADASVHFSYEMVALTPRTCLEMGIALSEEDRARPYVEVSGRKGLGVKADDLIDKLIETALAEVVDRHPEANAAEQRKVAEQIAVGALRYFMLKFTRNSVIAFDFHEALSFEGETGPYVQYASLRAGNIFRKFVDRGGICTGLRTNPVGRSSAALPGNGEPVAIVAARLQSGKHRGARHRLGRTGPCRKVCLPVGAVVQHVLPRPTRHHGRGHGTARISTLAYSICTEAITPDPACARD